MNSKTAKHLNYLREARILSVVNDGTTLTVTTHGMQRDNRQGAEDRLGKLRDECDAILRAAQPEVLRRSIIAAALADDEAETCPSCRTETGYGGGRYVGCVFTVTGSVWLDVCGAELEACVARRAAEWKRDYQVYRVACMQGVAVPPGGGE